MIDPNCLSDVNINISDVLDAIQTTDPTFAEQNRPEIEMIPSSNAGNTTMSTVVASNSGNGNSALAIGGCGGGETRSQLPYVKIIEQPASKALRFRYECESRTAGSIPGIHSTPENKTYPTIQIIGYRGRAIVVVSCVTRDPPYRPHPHHLVGKETCSRGVCTVEVSTDDNMTVTFNKLGVQCVKRRDIEDSLRQREEMRVDPFRTGYDHKRQPTSIDLNAVRLCFQVFLEGPEKGDFRIPLKPVVSTPVYDKKAMCDLVICKLSHCSASVAGGMEMVLLCEKVTKEDIQVRFFEERDEQIYWEGFGDFQPTQVHKQVAISFRTPSYRVQKIDQPVQVYIQLRRPSDNATSEALPFQLLPLGLDDPDTLRRKRQKFNNSPNAYVLRHVQAEAEKHSSSHNIGSSEAGLGYQFPQFNVNIVKTEPSDRLSPFGGGSVTATPSPPMYQVGHPTNMVGLRPINSPRRTPSPMDFPLYNVPTSQPQQQQNLLQPINAAQGTTSPIFMQNSAATTNRLDNNFSQHQITGSNGMGNTIGNTIGNAMNISNVLDNPQQASQFDLNFSQFDNVDLTNLNISDIVKEAVESCNNVQQGGVNNDNNGLDSFTKMCILNDLYKSTGNN